jgi:hypothetical protein
MPVQAEPRTTQPTMVVPAGTDTERMVPLPRRAVVGIGPSAVSRSARFKRRSRARTSFCAFVSVSCVGCAGEPQVTALGVTVAGMRRKFCCGLAADWGVDARRARRVMLAHAPTSARHPPRWRAGLMCLSHKLLVAPRCPVRGSRLGACRNRSTEFRKDDM